MQKEKTKNSYENKFNEKGVTGVIITCFLLLVSITSLIAYNTWFNGYMAEQYVNMETQDTNIALIHDVIGETLYLSNPYKSDMEILRIALEGNDCNFTGTIPHGMNSINIRKCAEQIKEPVVEVVVYTNKHVYSRYVFIDKQRLPRTNLAIGEIPGGSDCAKLYIIEENMSGDYFLTGDIDCIDTKTWNNGSGFEPIGNESISFTGTFDGKGYTIYNLYINHTDKETGLFGSLNGANISSLNFDLLVIDGLKKSSGALAGFAQNSIITNVKVKGDITGERKSVGGIIGELQTSIMSECSYESGTVTGDRKAVGGLVGLLDKSEIHNSFSMGNVTGIKEASGGLVGYQKDSIVNNSYSTGYVLSTQGSEGGLIGTSLNSNTYNSYWDIQTSSQAISAGGTGKTTIEMQTTTTYSTWDTNIWQINDGQYPTLK